MGRLRRAPGPVPAARVQRASPPSFRRPCGSPQTRWRAGTGKKTGAAARAGAGESEAPRPPAAAPAPTSSDSSCWPAKERLATPCNHAAAATRAAAAPLRIVKWPRCRTPPAMAARRALAAASAEELGRVVQELGHRPFRGQQISQWIHRRGAADFGAMHTLPADLRAGLGETYSVDSAHIAEERVSSDGTRKWLVDTSVGRPVVRPYPAPRPPCRSRPPTPPRPVRKPSSSPRTRGARCACPRRSGARCHALFATPGCVAACAAAALWATATALTAGALPLGPQTQALEGNLGASDIVGQVLAARRALGDFPRRPNQSPAVSNVCLPRPVLLLARSSLLNLRTGRVHGPGRAPPELPLPPLRCARPYRPRASRLPSGEPCRAPFASHSSCGRPLIRAPPSAA